MIHHLYMTVHHGIQITLEDGSESRTKRTERTFVRKISANQFRWQDAKGRICTADAKELFSQSESF
jgi:hypothetical protein